jgi:hypothetical protein
MKNSDTIGNRSRDLPVCSAVLQPLRHRVPRIYCSSGCNSGLGLASRLLWCLFFHGWLHVRKGCWSLYVEYDLLHIAVHLLWLEEFWIGISHVDYVGLAGANGSRLAGRMSESVGMNVDGATSDRKYLLLHPSLVRHSSWTFRLDHCAASKRREPITEWAGFISRKSGNPNC